MEISSGNGRIASRYCVVEFSSQISIEPAMISWENGKITEIERCSVVEYSVLIKKWRKSYPDLKIYDNCLVSPAFVNSHTHLAMNIFRGFSHTVHTARNNMVEDFFFRIESYLSPDDVRAFTRLGAYENLFNGVGFVWDHYYHGKALANGIKDTGLCAVVAPTLGDISIPKIKYLDQQFNDTIEIATSENFQSYGIYSALGAHAPDTCSVSLWKKVIESSEKYDLPIHYHQAQSFEEYSRLKETEGASPVEFVKKIGLYDTKSPKLAIHNIFLDNKDLDIISQSNNTLLCFCPYSSLIFGHPSPVALWSEKNINWALGTDTVASNDSMNIQKELKYISGIPIQEIGYSKHFKDFISGKETFDDLKSARRQAWDQSASFRDPQFLLDKVWSLPGELHPKIKCGKIKKDYLANIVLWDLNDPSIWPSKSLRNIVMGDTSSAIYRMICNGRDKY